LNIQHVFTVIGIVKRESPVIEIYQPIYFVFKIRKPIIKRIKVRLQRVYFVEIFNLFINIPVKKPANKTIRFAYNNI